MTHFQCLKWSERSEVFVGGRRLNKGVGVVRGVPFPSGVGMERRSAPLKKILGMLPPNMLHSGALFVLI